MTWKIITQEKIGIANLGYFLLVYLLSFLFCILSLPSLFLHLSLSLSLFYLSTLSSICLYSLYLSFRSFLLSLCFLAIMREGSPFSIIEICMQDVKFSILKGSAVPETKHFQTLRQQKQTCNLKLDFLGVGVLVAVLVISFPTTELQMCIYPLKL